VSRHGFIAFIEPENCIAVSTFVFLFTKISSMGDIDDKRDLTPEVHKIDGDIVELNLQLKGDVL